MPVCNGSLLRGVVLVMHKPKNGRNKVIFFCYVCFYDFVTPLLLILLLDFYFVTLFANILLQGNKNFV